MLTEVDSYLDRMLLLGEVAERRSHKLAAEAAHFPKSDVIERKVAGWSLAEIGSTCDAIVRHYGPAYRFFGPAVLPAPVGVVFNGTGVPVDSYRDMYEARILIVRRGSAWSIENGFEE